MSKIYDVDYLDAIGDLFSDHIIDYEIVQNENGPTLLMSADSHFEEDSSIGYTISMERGENGLILFHLIIIPFSDIPPQLFPVVQEAISLTAPAMTIGSFSLLEQEGMLLFSQGFILGEKLTLDAATANIFRNLLVMESIVDSVGPLFFRVINGELSPEDMKKELTSQGGDPDE